LELDKQGNIISYEEYHPFGTTSYRSGKTETEVSLKRYKYCGKERDEETGLYYYGMRYYAAWICRFISVDPLQFEYPYYTPYQYAGNKPISFIDLDGAEPGVLFENKFTNRIIEESYKPKPDSYKEGIKNGKIVYTQNYGWVDKTHAFTKTKRENVGADNLWNQIKNETGKQVTSKGEKGFLVTYRQDANVFGFSIGVEKTYFLKNGISIEDKERIAMAIFQEVSSKFENLQKYAFWSSSSFEPADLPSNILSFYSAVRPELTKEKILDLIQPLTMEQSLEVYKNYPGTFTDKQYKNKTFNPVFFPNEYSAENPQVPSELQEIQPAEKGNLFWNY
jgi:RHS repeat-associated protein